MESHTPRRGCWACYGQSSGQFLLSFLFLPFQKNGLRAIKMNYRVENINAKTTWQIVAFAQIIKRFDGPCSRNFWLCSFSKPYIALMWRKLLKWVLKAKLLVIVQLCRSCKSFDEFRTKAIQNFPILLSSFFSFLPKATQN